MITPLSLVEVSVKRSRIPSMRSNAVTSSNNKQPQSSTRNNNIKSKKTITSKKKNVFLRDRYDLRELNSEPNDSKDATLVERNHSIVH